MKYVAVLSSQPGADVYKPIFNYFEDYLITLGEPTAGNAKKIKTAGWNLQTIVKHAKKIIFTEKLDHCQNLFIDSGGFQIIVGHITESMISEYEQSYHFVLKNFRKDIYKIFSLDINNFNFSKETLISYNDQSITESIKLIKEFPEIQQKQLFVVQSRNTYIFEVWKDLMVKHNVFEFYRKWSIGGLVNLKKETNADFSHAIPITLWLLTYAKSFTGDTKIIEQVHWLGQSSRLAFIGMALIEKLYKVEMTADSSQLIRFAPIEHKMPFMYFDRDKNDFILAQDHDTIEKMFKDHSLGKEHSDITIKKFRNYTLMNPNFNVDHEEEEFTIEEELKRFDKNILKLNKNKNSFSMDNEDIIELQCQNIYYEMKFADFITDKFLEKDLSFWNIDNIKELHPILARGRIAKELANNFKFFTQFKNIIEKGLTQEADKIMIGVTESYSKHLEAVPEEK
jgi:hypothetical protein